MTAKYFVKKVETCSKCEGRQVVQHPAWVEYWKENSGKHPMSIKEGVQWFEEHGWYRGAMLDIGSNGLPYEEIPCDGCEGLGEIETEVDLLDVLPELLQAIDEKSKSTEPELDPATKTRLGQVMGTY